MKRGKHIVETVVHALFLLFGLVAVGCVLVITVYLVISGIPAIRKIGLVPFLFGKTWASTAAEPQYGILPFILTSVYGTAGAIVLGVPVGFLTAVYLAKLAPKRVKDVMQTAVSLLAGIPSVVYGLVGMLVLVPGIRKAFHLPDGASLLAAIIVLAVIAASSHASRCRAVGLSGKAKPSFRRQQPRNLRLPAIEQRGPRSLQGQISGMCRQKFHSLCRFRQHRREIELRRGAQLV